LGRVTKNTEKNQQIGYTQHPFRGPLVATVHAGRPDYSQRQSFQFLLTFSSLFSDLLP
jgi:hypothetical protein